FIMSPAMKVAFSAGQSAHFMIKIKTFRLTVIISAFFVLINTMKKFHYINVLTNITSNIKNDIS
ncbi:MAG: hypothetical protein M0Q91_16045, partial [Methanoregula sp.]|nr:hypothetical protein [Methanoregula sp.]